MSVKQFMSRGMGLWALVIVLAGTGGVNVGAEETDGANPSPQQLITDALAAGEDVGLSMEVGVTTIWQAASDTVDDAQGQLWSFSYDFVGEWVLIDDDDLGVGRLGWLVEGGRPLGSSRHTDLGANIGSGLGINDDLDSQSINLTELWWRQGFADEAVIVTLGKIDPTVFFDGNRVANDETAQFMATPLVNNIAIPFPDNGLGVNVTWNVSDSIYLSAGANDANADATDYEFKDFDIEELIYLGEAGYTATIDGLGEGTYRVIVWHSTVEDGSDSGFAVSFDQQISENWVPFFRYGCADGDVVDFKQSITVGVGYESPFGRVDDYLAVGFVRAESSDPAVRDESILEGFYRYQLTDWAAISPDVQVVFNPADNAGKNMVIVGGVRVQLTF